MGHDTTFEVGPVQTHLVVERGATMTIGNRVTVGFGGGIACQSEINIGDDVVLGPYVQLLDSAFHVTTSHRARPQPRPITIGAGATLGAWTMVLPGAEVGPGEVVPAGTVVTASRR